MATKCKLEAALLLFLTSLPTYAADRYVATARRELLRPSLSYLNTFSMSIARQGDVYVIDSLCGFVLPTEEHGYAYDGGLTLRGNGDGTYSAVTTGHNLLYEYGGEQALEQATVEDKYYLYLADESGRSESHEWKLELNADGSIAIGDFYIAHVCRITRHGRHRRDSIRRIVTVEAYYHDIVARKDTGGADAQTAIDKEKTDSGGSGFLSLMIASDGIEAYNLEVGERVFLYSADGGRVAVIANAGKGNARLPLPQKKGVYIICTSKGKRNKFVIE